jgi:hypothetical protein
MLQYLLFLYETTFVEGERLLKKMTFIRKIMF